MNKKYLNEAIIGNQNLVVSFSKKGELLRLFYPTRDYRQFVDTFYTGIKVNDSNNIYLHDDINNVYNQYYSENTNVLNTKIENTYFKVDILQTDFVSIKQDVIIKKYIITNNNSIDLNINFLIYSKLLSSFNNMVGTRVVGGNNSEDNIFMQYSHNYAISIFSKTPMLGYRLNNSAEDVKSGVLQDKDYEAMQNDSAVSFDLGTFKSGETKEFEVFININNNRSDTYSFDDVKKNIEKIKKIDVDSELQQTKKYWRKYVKEHDGLKILTENEINLKNITEEMKRIYTRSILLFPLLLNNKTGGISAALEVDEEKDKCGRYSYCWPRDAVFINKALTLLKMDKEVERFYTVFSKNTQSKNGMWEQRFYTDGKLAPCWGYQIDETAAVVYGVYAYYHNAKNKEFLKNTIKMCEKAIEFLESYVNCAIFNRANVEEEKNQFFVKYESYDIWENHQGIHLYSLSAIYAAFISMANIYKELEYEKSKVDNMKNLASEIKDYCLENLCDKQTSTLKRNNKDFLADISVLGTIIPFRMFDASQKEVKNTIEKINLTLRTYTGGYIRFENDSYMEGNNPWPIATLWMALYYFQVGNKQEAMKCIDFVTNTATEHGLLAEQIDNSSMTSKWVIGLGWSHAMYVVSLYRMLLDMGINIGEKPNKEFGK